MTHQNRIVLIGLFERSEQVHLRLLLDGSGRLAASIFFHLQPSSFNITSSEIVWPRLHRLITILHCVRLMGDFELCTSVRLQERSGERGFGSEEWQKYSKAQSVSLAEGPTFNHLLAVAKPEWRYMLKDMRLTTDYHMLVC